jgi:UDP-N-acetylglucosamine--N-acetylmuramyl-(pentapeptide) pyrophosphoryl-undecaprenol N-acetylglucosamine transferase
MRIVLTGGGTGGHVIPNLAVIEELKKHKDVELLYIGSIDGIEQNLIEKISVKYKGIYCGKFRRYFSFQNFIDPFKIPIGIFQAYYIFKKFQANVVFSKGGFVSVPVVVAAKLLKIPIILHESDAIPGLANRICFKFASKICLGLEESKKYIGAGSRKIVVTGNPIRSFLKDGDKQIGYKLTGLNKFRPVILVMGGSQGASQINTLVEKSIDELLKRFQIVHIRGRGNLDIGLHKTGYIQYGFLDEYLPHVYAIADLVVSRGGANSLAEIAYLKKKALIIPLGTSVSRGDQVENAELFAQKFGWNVLFGEISREDFINAIDKASKEHVKLGRVEKNGASAIANLILKTGK